MKETIIATYERPSDFTGCIVHKITRYHEFRKLECVVIDNTEERELGFLINGKPVPDYYDIVVYNGRGEGIHRYHYTNRMEANQQVKGLLRRYKNFKRVG